MLSNFELYKQIKINNQTNILITLPTIVDYININKFNINKININKFNRDLNDVCKLIQVLFLDLFLNK